MLLGGGSGRKFLAVVKVADGDEGCEGCGACVIRCPRDAIAINYNRNPHCAVVNIVKCTGCGVCVKEAGCKFITLQAR